MAYVPDERTRTLLRSMFMIGNGFLPAPLLTIYNWDRFNLYHPEKTRDNMIESIFTAPRVGRDQGSEVVECKISRCNLKGIQSQPGSHRRGHLIVVLNSQASQSLSRTMLNYVTLVNLHAPRFSNIITLDQSHVVAKMCL